MGPSQAATFTPTSSSAAGRTGDKVALPGPASASAGGAGGGGGGNAGEGGGALRKVAAPVIGFFRFGGLVVVKGWLPIYPQEEPEVRFQIQITKPNHLGEGRHVTLGSSFVILTEPSVAQRPTDSILEARFV